MNRFFKTVLLTGLFVGTTDMVAAFISVWIKNGVFASKMFSYIAGGALGPETSMKAGIGISFLGLFFHYFIATSYTLFFFWIFPRLRFLSFNKYLVGMLYAVFVNVTMDQVVLRLSRLPRGTFSLENSFINWVVLGVVLGIPIVYNAYKYLPDRNKIGK